MTNDLLWQAQQLCQPTKPTKNPQPHRIASFIVVYRFHFDGNHSADVSD
jgi:hypothetical protein